jgi:hypothetical protein
MWLDRALQNIGTLPNGYEFVLKDLFMAHVWDELKRGEKGYFGVTFKGEVTDNSEYNLLRAVGCKSRAPCFAPRYSKLTDRNYCLMEQGHRRDRL